MVPSIRFGAQVINQFKSASNGNCITVRYSHREIQELQEQDKALPFDSFDEKISFERTTGPRNPVGSMDANSNSVGDQADEFVFALNVSTKELSYFKFEPNTFRFGPNAGAVHQSRAEFATKPQSLIEFDMLNRRIVRITDIATRNTLFGQLQIQFQKYQLGLQQQLASALDRIAQQNRLFLTLSTALG